MSHSMTFQVFSSATRLLVLLESLAGVPDWQVATLGGRDIIDNFFVSFFFSQASNRT